MRILVVSPRFPWPLDKGDRLTVYHLLKHFSRSHELDLLTFAEVGPSGGFTPKDVREIQPFCSRIEIVPLRKSGSYWRSLKNILSPEPLQVGYFRRNAMARKVREMCRRTTYDILYTHLLRMAQYTKDIRQSQRVLAMQISLTLHFRRMAEHGEYLANPVKKRLYALEAWKLGAYEAEMTRHFDKVLLIGQKDKEEVEKNGGKSQAILLNPHGVDLERFKPSSGRKESCSIAFSGNMSADPNIDAVLWFYDRIYPRIRRAIPEVRFHVIGTCPARKVRRLARDPSVVVTGFVDDLAGYLGHCQLAVDPLRIGAGLQNKVLEAMALGLPVVVTPIANEGLMVPDGIGVVVARGEINFADRVVELLRDEKKREKIGRKGLEYVVNEFTWEKHFRSLETLLLKLAQTRIKT